MTTIRELFVALGANTDKAEVEAFDQALDDVKRTGREVVAFMGKLTAAAGGVAFGIWRMTRQSADAADEAAKMGARLGMTAEEVQELDHVAQLTGTSMNELERGFRRMQREVNAANEGSADSIALMEELGVQTHDTNGEIRSQADIFEDAVVGLSQIDDEARRSARAQEIFGRSGTRVLAMMDRQGVSISELREEARELGHVIDNESAEAFEEFNDNLLRGRRFLEGLRNTLAITLLPRLNDTIERLLDWARANQDVMRSRIEAFAERVGDIFERLAELAVDVNDAVQEWGGWEAMFRRIGHALSVMGLLKFGAKIAAFAGAVKKLIVGLKTLGVAGAVVFAKKIAIAAAVAAAIALIVLVVEDLITWIQGGDALIGRFFDAFDAGDDARDTVHSIIDAFREMGRMVMSLNRVLIRVFGVIFRGIWMIAEPIIVGLAQLTMWWYQGVMFPILRLIGDLFVWLFGGIADGLQWLDDHWEVLGEDIQMVAVDAIEFWHGAWQDFVQFFRDIIDDILGQIDRVREGIDDVPLLGEAVDLAGDAMDFGGGLVEGAMDMGGDVVGGIQGAFAPNESDNSRSVQQLTNSIAADVDVDASGQSDPEAVGRETAEQTGETLRRELRQANSAASGGEL